jgi:hypothetical protein
MFQYHERTVFVDDTIPIHTRASSLNSNQKNPVEETLHECLKRSPQFLELLKQLEENDKLRFQRTLLIDKIHHSVDENLLKILFEPFGRILSISIYKNGTSTGKAFIEFSHSKSVESAITNTPKFSLVLLFLF